MLSKRGLWLRHANCCVLDDDACLGHNLSSFDLLLLYCTLMMCVSFSDTAAAHTLIVLNAKQKSELHGLLYVEHWGMGCLSRWLAGLVGRTNNVSIHRYTTQI